MTTEFTNGFAFGDIHVGDRWKLGRQILDRDEVIEFAKRWDPMPMHIDEELAKATPFGGLTASGTHLLAIRIQMLQAHGTNPHVVASFGYEEVRFLKPARPGDTLTLFGECVWKRESKSQPDRGIVKFKFTMVDQHEEDVLSMLDSIMVRKAI
ncbi:MAG: MaoC/PaaZ C-terminal domain-containing protein [Proteobacteria bacterium]|nr:MaoC/PaaZ C-terminal domain-containing protein [Pseudomonadota bacterium]